MSDLKSRIARSRTKKQWRVWFVAVAALLVAVTTEALLGASEGLIALTVGIFALSNAIVSAVVERKNGNE